MYKLAHHYFVCIINNVLNCILLTIIQIFLFIIQSGYIGLVIVNYYYYYYYY